MLKHLSLRFDPTEDRLLLKLTLQTQTGQEATELLHLTRRICVQWRLDLQAMVDLSAQAPERLDPAAKAAVTQAHHQAVASQARTRTEPVSPSAEPADHGPPALVTKIVCGRRRDDGKWVLSFERKDQPRLGLILSSQTLHALVDAVNRRVQSAQWGLAPLPVEQANASLRQAAPGLH